MMMEGEREHNRREEHFLCRPPALCVILTHCRMPNGV